MMDQEKLMELGTYCTGMAHGNLTGYAQKMAVEMAAALARELFPPKAKALVWEVEDSRSYAGIRRANGFPKQSTGESGNLFDGRTGYEVSPHPHQPEKWFFYCRFDSESGSAESMEAAKAACESHHQSRWLEQMA